MANTKLLEAASVSRGRITARVPQNVIEVLETAATMVGSTLNQFVTQAAVEKAEKIIENERIIKMSAASAEWFFDLIDNPPPPAPALADAFKRYHAGKVINAGSSSTLDVGT